MQLRLADVPGLELAVSSIESISRHNNLEETSREERKRENYWEDHKDLLLKKTVKRLYTSYGLDSFWTNNETNNQ